MRLDDDKGAAAVPHSFGRDDAPIATKSSFTSVAVLALVSMKKMFWRSMEKISLAYDSAS